MGTITAVEAVSKFLKSTRSVGDTVHTPIELLTKSSRNSHRPRSSAWLGLKGVKGTAEC